MFALTPRLTGPVSTFNTLRRTFSSIGFGVKFIPNFLTSQRQKKVQNETVEFFKTHSSGLAIRGAPYFGKQFRIFDGISHRHTVTCFDQTHPLPPFIKIYFINALRRQLPSAFTQLQTDESLSMTLTCNTYTAGDKALTLSNIGLFLDRMPEDAISMIYSMESLKRNCTLYTTYFEDREEIGPLNLSSNSLVVVDNQTPALYQQRFTQLANDSEPLFSTGSSPSEEILRIALAFHFQRKKRGDDSDSKKPLDPMEL